SYIDPAAAYKQSGRFGYGNNKQYVTSTKSATAGSTGRNKIKLENFSNSAAADVISLRQTADGTLRIGSVVQHNIFGKGKVAEIENVSDNEVLIVDFEIVGKKKLLRRFAKINILSF
ncbi:MAG: hypothetical protein K2M03_05265, partial [Muribaculaceae bacterium]|nr:hypothetical protein [Muribaculaceae bacterium]